MYRGVRLGKWAISQPKPEGCFSFSDCNLNIFIHCRENFENSFPKSRARRTGTCWHHMPKLDIFSLNKPDPLVMNNHQPPSKLHGKRIIMSIIFLILARSSSTGLQILDQSPHFILPFSLLSPQKKREDKMELLFLITTIGTCSIVRMCVAMQESTWQWRIRRRPCDKNFLFQCSTLF